MLFLTRPKAHHEQYNNTQADTTLPHAWPLITLIIFNKHTSIEIISNNIYLELGKNCLSSILTSAFADVGLFSVKYKPNRWVKNYTFNLTEEHVHLT